jgi:hypothetical protein
LFQLSVAVNLGFGALVSFIDPIREETSISSTAIERYIADRTSRQSGKSANYVGLLTTLCQDHFRYNSLLSDLRARLRFYNGLAARIAFAVIAALSLFGLAYVSAIGQLPVPTWLIWIPIFTNSVPVLFAFWLCYELSTYYNEIRPLIEKCLSTIRRLETIT